MHDMGAIAAVREVDGKMQHGFELYVGGGLGTVPYQAKLFTEFLPVEELLPIAIAIARVYSTARREEESEHGPDQVSGQQARAGRIQAAGAGGAGQSAGGPEMGGGSGENPELLTKAREANLDCLQISAVQPEGFQRLVRDQRIQAAPGRLCDGNGHPAARRHHRRHSCARWPTWPRKYTQETLRTTVEQNMVLRWVSEADLPAVYSELKAAGLAQPGAGTIVDIAACPGTDTCKLGIASSRGLAGELRMRLLEKGLEIDEAIGGLHIKISGCFNSCGQHHVADIGFYGVSRNKNGYTVPHFQVLLGGQWEENAGAYGLAIGAVPSKRIPAAVERITGALSWRSAARARPSRPTSTGSEKPSARR